ncbi:hypothetical protein M9458_002499, partial [Cirrhinus mrigala]
CSGNMQQSGETLWGPSTQPKRQRRAPQYLEDFELGPVRQRMHVSPRTSSLQYMHGEEGNDDASRRCAYLKSNISEHAEQYSPSYDVYSNGLRTEWLDTLTPYRKGRNER